MKFKDFEVGQILEYTTSKNSVSYTGIVTEKDHKKVLILWAVSTRPQAVEYSFVDTAFFDRMEFVCYWSEWENLILHRAH